MSCLFGYCGPADDTLLSRMARLLSHRPVQEWAGVRMDLGNGRRVAIAHGRAPWGREAQVIRTARPDALLGYAGVPWQPGRSPAELAGHFVTNPRVAIGQLNGACVLAAWVGGELHLARDPTGVKVLYWARAGERLLFASEVKALFADPALPRDVRLAAIPEYLTFSYIPGERTMFAGVQELEAGTCLRFRPECGVDGVRVERYFHHEAEETGVGTDRQEPATFEAAATGLRHELERSVQDCCTSAGSGVAPAVFLSGGIDSSAVLALAARRFPEQPLRTFSVHFGDGLVNENDFISLMVERYRTQHTWLEVRPQGFLREMPRVVWALDEPIGDPITVPNFLLARAAAREGAGQLVLNGEGGDPCFGGPKNIPMVLASLYGPQASPAGRVEDWLERTYLQSYRRCHDDLRSLLAPGLWELADPATHLAAVLTPYFRGPRPVSFLNKLMVANMRLKGANLILVKVDKMTSANGVLALAPLFTRDVLRASLRCPPHFKLAAGIEKAILKRAVADIVPEPIVRRPKRGMMVPLRHWFVRDMRRYADRVLARDRLRSVGWLNPAYVAELRQAARADTGGVRAGLKLWMLITLMHWHEAMVQNFPRVIEPLAVRERFPAANARDAERLVL